MWVDSQQQVTAFGMDHPGGSVTPRHYTGYKIFSSRIFDFLPDGESNIFYEVLTQALSQGEKVGAYFLNSCSWYETGNFSSFVEASRAVLTHHWLYLESLFSFFEIPAMERIIKDHDVLLKPKDLDLPDSFQFSGLCCLAPEMTINENVRLHNVFCNEKSSLKANTSYTDQFVIE